MAKPVLDARPAMQEAALVKKGGAEQGKTKKAGEHFRKVVIDFNEQQGLKDEAAKIFEPKTDAQRATDRKDALKRNIKDGAGFDAAGLPNTPGQKAKWQATELAMIRADLVAENGYDRMVPADQLRARTQIEGVINSNQWLKDVYDKLPDAAGKQAFVESILTDENFQKDVKRNYVLRQKETITDPMKERRKLELIDKRNSGDPAYAGKSEGELGDMAAGQLEDEWRQGIENVVGATMQQVVDRQLRQADRALSNGWEEIQAEQAGKASEKAIEKLRLRMAGKATLKNDTQIDKHFNTLIKGGMPALLRELTSPPGPSLTVDEANLVINDPELMKKCQEQMAKTIVINKMRRGGMDRQQFYDAIDTLGSGDPEAGAELMNNFIQINANTKDNIRAAIEQGVIEKNFWQKLGSVDKKKALLFALIAGLALPTGAGVGLLPAGFASMTGAGLGAGLGAAASYIYDVEKDKMDMAA